jgi:FKBP-type peptidyl-prolyl cis-trans isomerase FklB
MTRLLTLAILVTASLVLQHNAVALQEETTPTQETTDSSTETQEFTAESLTEKASYLIGYYYAQGLKADSVEIDIDQFFNGMKDATKGTAPPMSDEEILAVQKAFEKAIVKKQQEAFAKASDENQRAGVEFMKKNSLVEGVKELENGVQYSVLVSGEGTENPRLTDRVMVHHKGTLIDGTVFANTLGGPPATVNVGGLPRGYTAALLQMKVGDKWMVYIPGDLAFGSEGTEFIGPNQTVIYEVELVEIVK